jgi:hypothetical protein
MNEELSFDAVQKFLFLRGYLAGPYQPLMDHRFVAGVLFPRWNDDSVRILHLQPGMWPYAEVVWHSDFSLSKEVTVQVTPEVVRQLLDEGAIEDSPRWSYAGHRQLLLNARGKQQVTEWFADVDFADLMKAGATFDGTTGQMHWR